MIHFFIRTPHGDKIAVAAPEGALVFKVTNVLQAHYGHNVTIGQFISEQEHLSCPAKITLGAEVL